MAVVFDDTFTETSDTTLASHTPDTGTGWTKENGSAATLEIVAASDIVHADSDRTNTQEIYTAQHSGTNAEYDVEVDIAQEGTGNSHPVGVVARFTDTSNLYSLTWFNRAPGDFVMHKIVGGTPTSLAAADTDNTWTAERIKFEIRDGTKKAFFGATEELSSTDNALTSQGEGGLELAYIGDTNTDIDEAWHFDNFTITEPDGATAQAVAATATGVAGLTRATLKTLDATGSGISELARRTFKTLAASATAVADLATVKLVFQTLAAVATGIATLTAFPIKTLAATATGTAALTRTTFKTLSAGASGLAALIKATLKTLAASAAGVAALGTFKLATRTLAATASGVAALHRSTLKTLAATAAGAAALMKATFKTLAAIATGVADLVVNEIGGGVVFQTVAATASGVAGMTRATLKSLDISAIIATTVEVCKVGSKPDPDFASVVLLTHLNADPPVDTSNSAHTLTVGSAASRDILTKKFGASSFNFINSTSSLISAPDHANWTLPQQYTVEGFVNFTDTSPSGNQIFVSHYAQTDQSWHVGLKGGNEFRFAWSTNGSNFFEHAIAWSPTGGTWYHWAVTRDSNDDHRLFINGALLSTVNSTASYHNSTTLLRLGLVGITGSESPLIGNLDDVRITSGVARYTAAFEPPECPFSDNELHLQTVAAVASGIAALRRMTLKLLRTVASGVAGLASVLNPTGLTQTLAATATGVVTLQRSTLKTLRAVASGIAGLATVINPGAFVSQSLNAIATGVANLTTDFLPGGVKTWLVSLGATATGVASMLRVHPQTLAATASGIATLATDQFKAVLIAVQAAGNALLRRMTLKTLRGTAIGLAGLVQGRALDLAAVAVGIATLSTARFKVAVLNAVAVGVAGLRKMTLKTLAAVAVGVPGLFQTLFKAAAPFVGHGGLGWLDGPTRWKRRVSTWRRRR